MSRSLEGGNRPGITQYKSRDRSRGAEVMKRYDLKYLLVTRSEKGMTLISHDGVAHIPTEAKEVFDVSGAGDTVVATLSAAVATGIDIKSGVELANRAAGIVVSKIGTTPIKIEELVNSIKSESHGKNSRSGDAVRNRKRN